MCQVVSDNDGNLWIMTEDGLIPLEATTAKS